MTACAAFGCKNRSGRKSENQKVLERTKKITFHKFPKNEVLREKWIEAVCRDKWLPLPTSTLCSEHFEEKYLDRTSLACVRLREGAVPTLFTILSYYQKNVQKHQPLKEETSNPYKETEVNTEVENQQETEVNTEVENQQETEVSIKVENQQETEANIKVENQQETEANIKVENQQETEVYIKVENQQETEVYIKVENQQETEANTEVENQQETAVNTEVENQQEKCNASENEQFHSVKPCRECGSGSPYKQELNLQIKEITKKYQKKIKILQQNNRRQKKKIAILTGIVNALKERNLLK